MTLRRPPLIDKKQQTRNNGAFFYPKTIGRHKTPLARGAYGKGYYEESWEGFLLYDDQCGDRYSVGQRPQGLYMCHIKTLAAEY